MCPYYHGWFVWISAILAICVVAALQQNTVEAVPAGEGASRATTVAQAGRSPKHDSTAKRTVRSVPHDDEDIDSSDYTLGSGSDRMNFHLQFRRIDMAKVDPQITLQWKLHGRPRRQKLRLPIGWLPHVRGPEYTIRAWPHKGHKVLMVVLDDPNSGTAQVVAPVFYQRIGAKWKLVNSRLRSMEVSDYGGFHVSSDWRHLWVWDWVSDFDHDPLPHRYFLRTFAIRQGRITLMSTRRTRKAYAPLDGATHGSPLSPANDPLREFGRQWTWWQYE